MSTLSEIARVEPFVLAVLLFTLLLLLVAAVITLVFLAFGHVIRSVCNAHGSVNASSRAGNFCEGYVRVERKLCHGILNPPKVKR